MGHLLACAVEEGTDTTCVSHRSDPASPPGVTNRDSDPTSVDRVYGLGPLATTLAEEGRHRVRG
ncbi:hypothetical protein CGZ69_31230 [Streptomyces peucetius subsp. caesius ATCC 27952]|nr:hypothetical protein CGZ69_31230 [Streptomyces peucetius subsp. caesius ATCC 27952]